MGVGDRCSLGLYVFGGGNSGMIARLTRPLGDGDLFSLVFALVFFFFFFLAVLQPPRRAGDRRVQRDVTDGFAGVARVFSSLGETTCLPAVEENP